MFFILSSRFSMLPKTFLEDSGVRFDDQPQSSEGAMYLGGEEDEQGITKAVFLSVSTP